MAGQGAPESLGAPPPYRRLGRVRFTLALLVLVWHTRPISEITEGWLRATGFGTMAVLVFFAISGFIVTEAILANYRGRPVTFLVNRVVRLWPGYLVALLLMALVGWASGHLRGEALGPRNLLANALSLSPSAPATDWLLGLDRRQVLLMITWALRVVFTFYLAVTASIFLGRWLSARWLPPLLLAVLLASLFGYHLFFPSPRLSLYLGLAPHFVLGVTAALLLNSRLERTWALVLLAVALPLCLGHAINFTTSDPDRLPWRLAFSDADFAGAAFWVLLLLWAWSRLYRPGSPAARAKDRLLGDLSYNIFLFHLPAIVLVAWAWPQKDWTSLLPAIALTLLFAALCSWLLDPALRRLRTLLRGRPLDRM